MHSKRKNPFKISYFCLAAICCLAFCIVFLYITYLSIQKKQAQYDKGKAEQVMDDWENQLELFEQAALKIAISNEYQPFVFKRNKYNEKVLLDDFEQYSHFSALSKECFLYYGGSNIFHSTGKTIELDIYLRGMAQEEQEHIKEALLETKEEKRVLSVPGNIYILLPFRVAESESIARTTAILVFIVNENDLGQRFQVVSGGMEGNLSFYQGDTLLYCNENEPWQGKTKKLLTVAGENGLFTIRYLPEHEFALIGGLLSTQLLLLVLTDVAAVFWIANHFAKRTYQPILDMSDKYRKEVPLPSGSPSGNTLEEIAYIMDRMLQNNAVANKQIQQKQEMLHRQFLQMLIEGNFSFDVQSYLENLKINLPGPFYYVVSISFEKDKNVTDAFLVELRKELEQISSEKQELYVYVVCSYGSRQLSVICSISEMVQKDELTECICEVAESFEYQAAEGVGNVYGSLTRLHASWLESMDSIHRNAAQTDRKEERQQAHVYDSQGLSRLCAALARGDEPGAKREFEYYTKQLALGQVSQLMQQYIFSDFLCEVTRQARKSRIELSSQDISLIIAANNWESFQDASLKLIKDFCERLASLKEQEETDKAYQIYAYINTHFAEYDLSIDKTATDLNTSTAMVRRAILKYTGKLYKDYLISLRIAYAKELLLRENMTVAEICQKVGYGNISYFIKLFKEINGVTPAKYREAVNHNGIS